MTTEQRDAGTKATGGVLSTAEAYERNARHGQNRTGVELSDEVSFDDFDSLQPVNPQAADEREDEEGEEIRARVHALGHDVVADDDADGSYDE